MKRISIYFVKGYFDLSYKITLILASRHNFPCVLLKVLNILGSVLKVSGRSSVKMFSLFPISLKKYYQYEFYKSCLKLEKTRILHYYSYLRFVRLQFV